MTVKQDVVIVGGGFAGLTAARELSQRGLGVTVLEGRDRIGGRTWTDERLGRRIEMGGTWVHPTQPHVWSELTRYGLSVDPSPNADRYIVSTDEGPVVLDEETALGLLEQGLEEMLGDARTLMPSPAGPFLTPEELAILDAESVGDRLDGLEMSELGRTIVSSFFAVGFQTPDPREISRAHGVRITALSNWDVTTELEAAAALRIEGGMGALTSAIAADSSATLNLSTTVASITAHEGRSIVETTDGQQYSARSVIVTVPINTLGRIAFDPPLSGAAAQVAADGQAARGMKVWARVKGPLDPFFAFATPAQSPFHVGQYEFDVDGDSLVVLFGSDNTAADITDLDVVQTALRRWIPDVEVVAVDGHDWTADEFSLETWSNLKPGQYAAIPDFHEQGDQLLFAGADYATVWNGYVDGAIETGLRAARTILRKGSAAE